MRGHRGGQSVWSEELSAQGGIICFATGGDGYRQYDDQQRGVFRAPASAGGEGDRERERVLPVRRWNIRLKSSGKASPAIRWTSPTRWMYCPRWAVWISPVWWDATSARRHAGCRSLSTDFISSVAALLAVRLAPACDPYIFPSHCSNEPAGQMVLDALGKQPYILANMCLGEGTGRSHGLYHRGLRI